MITHGEPWQESGQDFYPQDRFPYMPLIVIVAILWAICYKIGLKLFIFFPSTHNSKTWAIGFFGVRPITNHAQRTWSDEAPQRGQKALLETQLRKNTRDRRAASSL